MKCLVLDDEPVAQDILRDYIGKVPFLECVGIFRNPLKALEYFQKNEVNLLFLDIRMPNLSGVQFLKTLSCSPLVIFTTAYSEHALESYEYDAVDYLLKPITFERFLKAVQKAAKRFQEQAAKRSPSEKSLLIKSGSKYYKISPNDVLFIKAAGNYVSLITREKEILSWQTMKEVLRLFTCPPFVRVHKSFIVNFHYVKVIESNRLRIGECWIPIGGRYREDFLNMVRKKQNLPFDFPSAE